MGIGGVPFQPSKQDILDAIRDLDGVLSRVAAKFQVRRQTIYTYIEQHPDVKIFLDSVRADVEETINDEAEYGLRRILNTFEQNSAVALKAIQYRLNNKAKNRGYNYAETEAVEKGFGMLDKIESMAIAKARKESKDAEKDAK